jgi:hypothetical protein
MNADVPIRPDPIRHVPACQTQPIPSVPLHGALRAKETDQ